MNDSYSLVRRRQETVSGFSEFFTNVTCMLIGQRPRRGRRPYTNELIKN